MRNIKISAEEKMVQQTIKALNKWQKFVSETKNRKQKEIDRLISELDNWEANVGIERILDKYFPYEDIIERPTECEEYDGKIDVTEF